MKIILERCCRCGKGFDFEMYNGLCPNCGCFHRAKGVTTNNTMADKYVARAENGTLEAKYEKHIAKDAAKGISHENGHKTTVNQNSVKRQNQSDRKKDKEKKPNIISGVIIAIVVITFLWDLIGAVIEFFLGL